MRIRLDKWVRNIEGYSNGFGHPTVIIKFLFDDYDETSSQLLTKKIIQLTNPTQISSEITSGENLPRAIGLFIFLALKKIGMPIFDQPKLFNQHADSFVIQIPFLSGYFGIVDFINPLIEQLNKLIADPSKKFQLETHVKEYAKKIKLGKNPPLFFAEAHKKKISLIKISEQIYQFGIAKNSIWLDSTFTCETPVLSANIARNKVSSCRLLKIAGLPVPFHIRVKTVDDALRAAEKIGYPVVIKPFDLDGGAGVFANLKNPSELQNAFERTVKCSKNIIVEKHITGKDYRLTVMRDKLLWTILREPPTIIGDGLKTIRLLLDDLNAKEGRGKRNGPLLIAFDDELLEILKESDLTVDSVLPVGHELPLRKRANVATGAIPKSINSVHPDNQLLAIKAAKIHKLDLAGIDLIIKDISKSWKEIGGAICEVNAQPQLGSITSSHLFSEILDDLLIDGRSVPVVCILTNNTYINELSSKVSSRTNLVGFASKSEAFSSLDSNNLAFNDLYSNLRIHAVNKDLDKIIFEVSNIQDLSNGLPFKEFDFLVLDCGSFAHDDSGFYSLAKSLFLYSPKKVISLGELKPAKIKVSHNISSIDEILGLTS